MTGTEQSDGSHIHEKDHVPEIQGVEIPPYSRELQGSSGIRRGELSP